MNYKEERYVLAKWRTIPLSFASAVTAFLLIWGLIHHNAIQVFMGVVFVFYYGFLWHMTISDLKKGKS